MADKNVNNGNTKPHDKTIQKNAMEIPPQKPTTGTNQPSTSKPGKKK